MSRNQKRYLELLSELNQVSCLLALELKKKKKIKTSEIRNFEFDQITGILKEYNGEAEILPFPLVSESSSSYRLQPEDLIPLTTAQTQVLKNFLFEILLN